MRDVRLQDQDAPARQIYLTLWQADSKMAKCRLNAYPAIGAMLAHSRTSFEGSQCHTKAGLFDESSRVTIASKPARLLSKRRQFAFQIKVERIRDKPSSGPLLTPACFADWPITV